MNGSGFTYTYTGLASKHKVLHEIFQSRGLSSLNKNLPLWQLKITSEEYHGLKETLLNNKYELSNFGVEAALCYAEWWRREYTGNIPSKEDVAIGIGLEKEFAYNLFKAAYMALQIHKYEFIHSKKGTEYFRTLLNQGGLPMAYIKNADNGFGGFKRFLSGLINEISAINFDWNNYETSIINQFNCISYLGNAFKNENIYDVALQIAHAIILDDNDKLPYDDSDASLKDLTQSLKKSYQQTRSNHRLRPLSLHWKLQLSDSGIGHLFVNLDVVKDISSDSIPGLNYSSCYAFDVFVAGELVGKYIRKKVNYNKFDEIESAIYTKISTGVSSDILWKGEPVVEVKIRCDNDERIFLTIAGCYPPNFSNPQVFQMLDDNIYVKTKTANAENNVVVFSLDWSCDDQKTVKINENIYGIQHFKSTLTLTNLETGEIKELSNHFTPYSTEFSGNYIPWIEESNYKLMNKIPVINVYDKEKERVSNIKIYYRQRSNGLNDWKRLGRYSTFELGLIDLKVIYPDGFDEIETFYYIGNLSFSSQNENALSTEIICKCDTKLHVAIETDDNIYCSSIGFHAWRVSRKLIENKYTAISKFRIYNEGNVVLRLSIATPFDGVVITDVYGQVLENRQIISLSNLSNYQLICHGKGSKKIDVSYYSSSMENPSDSKHLKRNLIEGIVSLIDYQDLINRMFNMYGLNSFDRNSSVIIKIQNKEFYIRRFILDSVINEGYITVTNKDSDQMRVIYDGSLYALPVDESVNPQEFFPIELKPCNDLPNKFSLPDDYSFKKIILFSGAESKYRIIPKYFNLNIDYYDVKERRKLSKQSIHRWSAILKEEQIYADHWRIICSMFEICSRYDLPYSTHNGFKAIANDPELLAKLILAMWFNNSIELLKHEIDYFEQELAIAFHWISADIWHSSINKMINDMPSGIQSAIVNKIPELLNHFKEIFDSTLSPKISTDYLNFINGNSLEKATKITKSEINEYKSKIKGLSDNNKDLPIISYSLKGDYFVSQEMPHFYRVMMQSAMCAAECAASVNQFANLFSLEYNENARIINFYRRYYRETYCDIFIRTLKIITNDKT